MFTIAFFGNIQHELSVQQSRKLIDVTKNVIDGNFVAICNANGIFKRASKISTQVEMLFDSGIDYIFLGEQAVVKNAGRNELINGSWPLIRPLNLADNTIGIGKKHVSINQDKLWMLSITQSTGALPSDNEVEMLEDFFNTKSDDDPVIINMNGPNLNLKESIVYKYCNLQHNICWVGTGCDRQIEGEKVRSNLLILDCGSVKGQGSIEGIPADTWWKRNIDKIPIPVLPPSSEVVADLSVISVSSSGIFDLVEQRKIII